jgi:hypothetical protein
VAHVVAGGELEGELVGVGREDGAEAAAWGGGAVVEGGEVETLHGVDGVQQRRRKRRVSFSFFFFSAFSFVRL